jgi:hypothetical protein
MDPRSFGLRVLSELENSSDTFQSFSSKTGSNPQFCFNRETEMKD